MSLLEILCSLRYSCSLCALCVLRMLFVFKGLWWKFFKDLEAWIYRASPINDFLKLLEAFEFDSNEL